MIIIIVVEFHVLFSLTQRSDGHNRVPTYGNHKVQPHRKLNYFPQHLAMCWCFQFHWNLEYILHTIPISPDIPWQSLYRLSTVFTDTLLTVFTDTLLTVFTDTLLTVFTDTLLTVFTDTLLTVFTDTLLTVFTDTLLTVFTDTLLAVFTDTLSSQVKALPSSPAS